MWRNAIFRSGVQGVLALLLVVPIARGQASPEPARETAASVLSRYCTACHRAEVATAGVVIDPEAVADVAADPQLWETVASKLNAGSMPPSTAVRPAPEEYALVSSYLEGELDRAGAADPNPGRLPLLHRLTRTEYRNAVRDLLGLEALPAEMNYDLLLPADNASSGFDNIAELLFVSPATMERYLDAARKISRLAVGDATAPAMVNIHRLHPERLQDARVEGLPFGTRGGAAIESHFPLDGTYVIDVEVSGRADTPHLLEVSIDGERVELVELGGQAAAPTTFEIPMAAGTHLVGVTFVDLNEALDEETLRPRQRSRGTEPAIATVTVSGPYDATGAGSTAVRDRIFVCHPDRGAAAVAEDEAGCASRILTGLAARAYRRPVSTADVADLMPFFEVGRDEAGFDRGIQRALERLLVSPQFLFRIEREPEDVAPGAVYEIDDLELASRLSFFIWSSIPDPELIDAAVAGDLREPAALRRQVDRMLADPRAEALITNFAWQWLFLGDVELKDPDPLVFRHYDETLREAFERETELFLSSVLLEDRSVLELLDADYTFVNERLAEHYGIPNVEGSAFRRVALPPDSPRGGLLGQGSILTLTSYSTRTSPVLRGKFVLDNLLASPPPPPPPDVPALVTSEEGTGEELSMREAMVAHRANPVCASCHASMDPIGFALENFDAIGRWRDTVAGESVDASGVFPDGTAFEGVRGLKEVLLADPERFVTAMAERLLMFAIGRNTQYYDMPSVREIVRNARADDYRFSSLVADVVESVPFRMRVKSVSEAE
jgi:mono/diheme cytochrome c family protein